MASERENFNRTGPTYLTAIDWNNSHHRKSIAASLVQGVYILERDHQENRQGPQALAPAWWEFFNFGLNQVLVDDDDDKSFFGAIYEFRFPYAYPNYTGQGPPQYVIAFRGTINKSGSRTQDYKLNLRFIVNNLEKSSRFQAGMEVVRNLVHRANGPGNIWIAGHSTGASIALLIGRNMVKMGIHLESYLFNSPFASPHIEGIKNEKLKHGLRLANSVLTAGLAIAANGGHKPNPRENDAFTVLSTWVPYLFVNPSDPICSEYIGYFEHREKMETMGAGKIGKISTQHSIGSIVSAARGKASEPMHLLPSAYLTINLTPSESFKEAHGIHQWWKPDLQFNYKLHQHK